MPQVWNRAFLGAGLGCLFALTVLWPTLVGLTSVWQGTQSYQYAWLVIPMGVYLLGWHHRQLSLTTYPRPDFSGVVVAVGAALLWSAAALVNIDVGRQLALILVLQGIAMSTLGWRSYWKLFPILALMFFMVPSGDFLVPALRILTVKIIELFATVVHLPHSVDGFVITVAGNEYTVIDECAGLPYFLLATFLGYSFGLMLYRSVFKIAALTVFGAFIGILSNALRVSAIVWVDRMQGSQMTLTDHTRYQWLALCVAMGLLFFILSKLGSEPAPVAAEGAQVDAPNLVRQAAPVIAGFVVLLIVGAVSQLALSSAQQLPARAGRIPQSMLGWELTSPSAVWLADQQNQTETLALSYQRDGKNLRVVITETLAPNAKLQESEIAPGDRNVWHENKVEKQTGCSALKCLTLQHTTWQSGKTDEIRHVYSAYAVGKFATTSKLALRAASGWDRLTRGGHRARLIGFALDAAASKSAVDDLAAAFQLLQAELEAGGG